MYVRAQFTEQAFKDLLRFRTSSMTRPCPRLYFEESRLLLTRVELIEVAELFAGPQRAVNYPNNRPQELVFQKSRLGVKLKFRVTGATLNASHDPEPIPPQEGFVKVALDVVVQNGKDFLSVEVLETDFDSLLSLAADKQEMSNLLSAGQVELGLLSRIGELAKDVGGFLTVRHADLGFDLGADRVELRVEFESSSQTLPAVLSEWSRFYANSLESITGSGAWAFLLDQRIGTGLLSRVMTAAIDGTGEFSRDGDVSVRWDAGLPGYRAGVEGEVIDACWCLWGEIDLDVRLWAEARFSLQNGRLRVDVRIDHKITDVAEAACCVLTAVALFPVVGLGLAIKGDVAWYEYLAGLALYPTPILLMVAAIAKLSSKNVGGLPAGICQTDPSDDKHFFCEFGLPELSEAASCQGAKLTVRADSLMGRGDGLVLGGRIEMPAIVDPVIGVDITGFKYTPPRYDCSGGGRPELYLASLRVFRASGNYDFRVCQVHVLGPFKYAAKVELEEMTCPYTAWVTISIGVTQYDHKPVKVIVSTTHGAIHAVIPAGQPVSEEHRREADLAARIERVNRCYAKSRRWDLRWQVDPAPYTDVVRTRQIWTVVGIAAAQARRVDVINEADAPLAVVDTSAGRTFRLSVIEPGGALSVVQNVADESERLEDADVHVVQTLAGVERELEFETPVVAVDAVRMSPVQTVVVHERERLTLFQVSERGELLRMGALETGGVQWVGRRRGTLYAALRDGHMLRLDLEDGPTANWREERAVKKRRPTRGCGCGGAKADEAAVEHPGVGLPLDTRQFDHLVHKVDICGGYSRGARIRHGYWIEETEGVLVTRALDRKLQGGGEVRMDNPAAGMVIRLRNGALLAGGEGRNQLELLRVLARQEL